MDTLFLAWQDPKHRRWYTIGRLDRHNGMYTFLYTKGALDARESGFTPLVSFPNLERRYESKEIFPLFENRVLSRQRPEFKDFVQWLSIPEHDVDPVAILARTGGDKSDTLEIFPMPERDDDTYNVHFFVRGLRHQAPCSLERVRTLKPGERLRMLADFQNPHDLDAVALRTDEQEEQDMHLLGYVPRYLAGELRRVKDDILVDAVVRVARVNEPPAPVHFRILCSMKMRWPEEFEPFNEDVYQPIVAQ